MAKEEIKTEDQAVEKEVKKTEKKEKFDGMDISVNTLDGINAEKVAVKSYLSDDEASVYLGGLDPKNYFYEGKVPVYFKKNFGGVLTSETDFMTALPVFDEVFGKVPEEKYGKQVLFFNPNGNRFTILLDKRFSTLATVNGEFTDEFHPTLRQKFCVRPFDARSIMFNGALLGNSYVEDVFRTKLSEIRNMIVSFKRDNSLSL
jgi:hypothetical protein